jgi:transcriptional regulator with XRE-family HTH domain
MTSNLKSIRVRLRMTQRDLASVFGQTPANISHYETGKQELPPACARALIAAAKDQGLDLTFDEIYITQKLGAGETAPITQQEAA